MLTPNEKSVKLHRKLTTLTRLVRVASLAEAIGGSDVAVVVRLRFAEADKVYRVARKIYDGPLSDTHDLASDVWDQIHGQWCVIRSDPAGGPGMTIFLDARPDVAYTYSMPTATEVARIVTAIRAHLGPQVLRPDWRKRRPADAVASWGCCYVAAEAAYHALGGENAGLKVMHVNHEGSPHWYLVDLTCPEVVSLPSAKRLITRPKPIDPTADQFATPVPYAKGNGKGFLTLQPSKRAQALLVAAGLI